MMSTIDLHKCGEGHVFFANYSLNLPYIYPIFSLKKKSYFPIWFWSKVAWHPGGYILSSLMIDKIMRFAWLTTWCVVVDLLFSLHSLTSHHIILNMPLIVSITYKTKLSFIFRWIKKFESLVLIVYYYSRFFYRLVNNNNDVNYWLT
jgi:hypothetical protein